MSPMSIRILPGRPTPTAARSAPAGLSFAKVNDGESASGKAYSAIGGNIGITITDPEHQTQDIGTIRRDTDNTNTSLPGLPDLQNILRDQYKTQADLQEAQKTMAGLVGDIGSELYKQAALNQDQVGMDYWKEGGAGRALLHAIGGGILGGVNGWEGAIKAALGGAATTLMALTIAELVKGMLKGTKYEGTPEGDALAKLIGATLAAGVGGAVGGAEGAGYGAANYQYNYLDHADNDALNAAKAACDASKRTDTKACGEQTRLEAKDKQQQDAYVACQPGGFQAVTAMLCSPIWWQRFPAIVARPHGFFPKISIKLLSKSCKTMVAWNKSGKSWRLTGSISFPNKKNATGQSLSIFSFAILLALPPSHRLSRKLTTATFSPSCRC